MGKGEYIFFHFVEVRTDDCHATGGGHGLEFYFLRCLRQLMGEKSDTLSVQVYLSEIEDCIASLVGGGGHPEAASHPDPGTFEMHHRGMEAFSLCLFPFPLFFSFCGFALGRPMWPRRCNSFDLQR